VVLNSIQMGRAFAAMAVALQHTIRDADRYYERYVGENPGFAQNPTGWVEVLAAGVDVFFIISGVVMVLSTQQRDGGLGGFLYRRVTRIYPLYWVLTIAYIGLLLAAPALFQVSYLEPVHMTCSLLLVPCIGPGGEAIPYIYAGWTLTYELVFYLLFGLSLIASGRWARVIICIALVLLWHSLQYSSLASIAAVKHSSGNIMLEFIFGLLLGQLWLSWKFPGKAGWPLIVAALALFCVSQQPIMLELPRFLQWGVPALLFVGGLMCLEARCQSASLFSRGLVFLGAASYSLYLFHFFSLRLFFVGLGKLGMLNLIPPTMAVLLGFIFTVIASSVVYLLLEKPLHQLFRKLPLLWQKGRPHSAAL